MSEDGDAPVGFWDALPAGRLYLVLGSVLAVASTASDLLIAQRAGGQRSVLDSAALLVMAVAFLAQWWRTTAAFALLLPQVVLVVAGADPVLLVLLLPVLLGSALATAERAVFAWGALVSASAWTLLLPWAAGEELEVLWVAVPLTAVGAAVGVAARRMHHQRRQHRQRLAEAERRAHEAAERERRILARDLHDIVAHNLTIISMQTSAAAYIGTGEAAQDVLRVVGDSAREALVDLRRMLSVLQQEGVIEPVPAPGTGETDEAATVAQLGVGAHRMAEELRLAGIDAEASVDIGSLDLNLGVRAALYRVMQEAVTNVAKHAGPGQRCSVCIAVDGPDVVLEVLNSVPEGGPRDAGGNSSGIGLTSMRDRIEAFGGRLEAGPAPGGWRVRAKVPHHRPS